MNPATFDTHAAVRKLEDAGMSTDQAEAIVSTVNDAVRADLDRLATKADLYRGLLIHGGSVVGAVVLIVIAAFQIAGSP